MTHVRAVGATDGETFDFGGFGVTWRIDGRETDQRFSVVHHPLAPHALAAPLHRHHYEDELSYVLTGSLGVLLGNEVMTAPCSSTASRSCASGSDSPFRRSELHRPSRTGPHVAFRLGGRVGSGQARLGKWSIQEPQYGSSGSMTSMPHHLADRYSGSAGTSCRSRHGETEPILLPSEAEPMLFSAQEML